MALKSKRSAAGANLGGKNAALAPTGKLHPAGVLATKTLSERPLIAKVETIEARLERKATLADKETFTTKGLGQMTREQRHKLLYGD